MAQSCNIETLDRSGRWYFTPGAKSIYDLRIRNDANNPLDCLLVLEDPPSGAAVEPQTFSLRGHEVRTVTVTFAADAPVPRSQRVLLTLRDNDGAVQASFEHPLIITGGSDCSISLAWKDALIESGEMRGFELTCSVRSQSDGPTSFALAFTAHPALTFPPLEPITLEPGESAELTVPVRWNRSMTDAQGLNHPALLEVGVPVSNGRRTSRLRWDAIETQLQPFAWNNVLATVQAAPASRNGGGKTQPPAHESVSPPQTDAAPEASKPAPAIEKDKTPADAAAAAPTPATAATPAPAPPPAPAQTATALPMLNGHAAAVQLPSAQSPPGVATEPRIDLPLFSGVAADASAGQPADVTTTTPPATTVEKAAADLVAADAATLAPGETGFTPRLHRETAVARHDQGTLGRAPFRSARAKKIPAGFFIAGLAAIALVISAAVLFRPWSLQPTPSVAPVVVNTPVVAANTAISSPVTRNVAAHKSPARKLKPANSQTRATAAPTATPGAVATSAPTVAPTPAARPTAAAQQPTAAAVAAPPRRQFRRPRVAAPLAGPVVALGGLEAHYGAGGRAVRVNWAAAQQTAANVQLIDSRGATVNSITVRGYRQSVLLYLPPRYRGSVTVQLTSTGRLGERVAQTAFLPPFGD
ncbi:MAG TPA: hypothetical protein VKR99_04905 [Candidatus Eremiobacteraceae bacterium]|nr:hypothetical protein [Candidatus Eremiobacteraceae bacterium]